MATARPGVWGIDLGQCALKALRLEMVDGALTATAFDYIEHPKILSQPDADPDQLTREALEQFLSRNNLKGDTVAISVPGQSGLARFVKLPPVEEKKIADIVRFEAKQQIPFPLDEVVWDFQKVGSGVVSDGFALETEIGLFAMKRDMINRFLGHFSDVHVEVHLIQMAPLGLCNFVTYDLLGKDASGGGDAEGGKHACIVALDIGTDNSNLVITDGEKIIWQRPIPLGGNHFTRALTKDLKLTFAKAEHLKRNAVKSPDLKKILGALKPVLNDFVSEVQRSLGYFTNTHRDAQIQYLIGLGNAFRLPGLQKYLQEKLQLEVRKLQKLERLSGDEVVAAPTFTENILGFGVAYGLALQGVGLTRLQTNLLPHEIRTERMIRAKKPWAAAAAASLLLGIAGMAWGLSLERANVGDQRIPAAENKYKQEQKVAADFDAAYQEQKKRIEKAEREIMYLSAGVPERDNWALLYRYISLALPRPDAANLAAAEKRMYYDEAHDAQQAYRLWQDRRYARARGQQVSAAMAAKIDEFIKNNLVQINVEGITEMYTENFAGYFERILAGQPELRGMDPPDQEIVKNAKDKQDGVPKKGWVIEIRGYTYHFAGGNFVQRSFLMNLKPAHAKLDYLLSDADKSLAPKVRAKMEAIARLAKDKAAEKTDKSEEPTAEEEKKKPEPAKPKVDPFTPDEKRVKEKLEELAKLQEKVQSKVAFFLMYKGTSPKDRIENPQPGQFVHIKTSYLPALVRGGSGGDGGFRGGPGAPGLPGPGGPAPNMPAPGGLDPAKDAGGGQQQGDAKSALRDAWRPLGSAGDIVGAGAPVGPGFGGPGGLGPVLGPGAGIPGAGAPPPPPRGEQGEGAEKEGPVPAGDRATRTEFVILFIWQEPITSDPAAATDTPAPTPTPDNTKKG